MMPLTYTQPCLTHERNGGFAMSDRTRAFHSTRVEVAVTQPDRPLTPMTQEQAREWAYHVGGVEGVGPSLAEVEQREKRDQMIAATIAVVGAVIVAAVMLWITGFLVDTFWVRS